MRAWIDTTASLVTGWNTGEREQKAQHITPVHAPGRGWPRRGCVRRRRRFRGGQCATCRHLHHDLHGTRSASLSGRNRRTRRILRLAADQRCQLARPPRAGAGTHITRAGPERPFRCALNEATTPCGIV